MIEGPTPHAHAPEVRRRALHVWIVSRPQSQGFRSAVRLGLIATYSIVFMWSGFFDWSGTTETVLWSLAAILWIVVLGLFVRELVKEDRRGHYIASHLSLPLLLIAPAFLWLTWMPVAAFVLVVVAYILELRFHSAGDGFLFSFGLVLFIGVFAGLSMVEIENDDPASPIRTPSDGLFWAFASLLRINYGKTISPETQDGRVLATVVGICALLAASLFTAQVVSWVVGSQQDRDEAERTTAEDADAAADAGVREELAEIRRELAAIREALGSPPRAPGDGSTVAP